MNNLIPINFNDEIVITTKMLAEVYECKEQQITQNFNYSRDKFEEKKHYYKLTGEALKKLRIENSDLQISPMTRTFYLWTKRGASRHCKMLGTDKAWDMFDSLEENYFNPKVPQLSKRDYAILGIVNAKDDISMGVAIKNFENIITAPLLPKANWFDSFISGEGLYSSTQVAKILHISSAMKLNRMLCDEGIIYKRGKCWFPYVDTDSTWYKIIVGGNENYSYSQLRFTPKGLYEISKLLDIELKEEDLNNLA